MIKLCIANKINLILLEYPEGSCEEMYFLAQQYNVPLVGYNNAFLKLLRQGLRDKYFVPDGHCTKEGYGVMAEAIAEEVLRILE